MSKVHHVSRDELETRRNEILAQLGRTYDELASDAARYSLVGDEWSAWEEIKNIDFLLGDQ